MARLIFNGTAVSLTPSGGSSTSFVKLRGASGTDTMPKVRVTGSDDASELYEPGIPDGEYTVDVVGPIPAGFTKGAKGSLTVAWADGTTDGPAYAMIQQIKRTGQINGEITRSVTFVPTPND